MSVFQSRTVAPRAERLPRRRDDRVGTARVGELQLADAAPRVGRREAVEGGDRDDGPPLVDLREARRHDPRDDERRPARRRDAPGQRQGGRLQDERPPFGRPEPRGEAGAEEDRHLLARGRAGPSARRATGPGPRRRVVASPAGTSSPFTTASTPAGTFGPRRSPGAKAVLATAVTPGTSASAARRRPSSASGPGQDEDLGVRPGELLEELAPVARHEPHRHDERRRPERDAREGEGRDRPEKPPAPPREEPAGEEEGDVHARLRRASARANSSKSGSESCGPGADSGWYWTAKTGRPASRNPSHVPSFRLTCVSSSPAGSDPGSTAKPWFCEVIGDDARREVLHRVVHAPVAELQLERPRPEREAEELVPEADAEDAASPCRRAPGSSRRSDGSAAGSPGPFERKIAVEAERAPRRASSPGRR